MGIKAEDVKPGDSLELTFQHDGGFVKDWCKVLEISTNDHDHLTFRMISDGGIYLKLDYFHHDELTNRQD
jgi:hypothetical protein